MPCGRGGWAATGTGRSVLVEDPGNGEALGLGLGRSREALHGSRAGNDLVGTGDMGQRHRVTHWLDPVGGGLLDGGDGFEDDRQLTQHPVELGLGQVDTSQ